MNSSPTSSPSTDSTAHSASKSSGRWWRWPLYTLLVLLLAVLVLLGGVVWWATTDRSLPRALHWAQQALPESQQLQFEGARGAILGDGAIDRLEWQMPGTALTLEQFQLAWTPASLWNRALQVNTLEAESLTVRLSPSIEPEEPKPPFAMPDNVLLPLLRAVHLPLRLNLLALETEAVDGSISRQELRDMALSYDYDGSNHDVQLQSLHHQQQAQHGQLQARVRLNGQTLDVEGQAVALLGGLIPDKPLTMLVPLQWQGSLAGGADAQLQVQLQGWEWPASQSLPEAAGALLQLDVPQQLADFPDALKLDAQAGLHPWRGQPVQQARVQLHRLNAQDFHPQAPVTLLDGALDIQPAAAAEGAAAATSLADTAWQLLLELRNQQPGAWDAQRLPVRQLDARARWGTDAWQIEQAQVQLGEGRVGLQGELRPQQPEQAHLQVQLERLNLQQLLGSLPQTQLDGQARVEPLAVTAPTGAATAPETAAHADLLAVLTAASWQVQADVRNAIPGLVDKQRLPLDQVLLQAQLTPQQWQAENLEVRVGEGRLQVQAQYAPDTQQLAVNGQLTRLPLVRLHSELAAEKVPDLSGTLKASGSVQEAVAFEADIQSNGRAQAVRSRWNVRALQAQGEWTPRQLSLPRLHLDAFQAKVDARDVQVALPDLASLQARLTVSAPGLNLQADTAMRQQSGQGKLQLDVASAQQLLAWLRQLPLVGEQLPAMQAQGSARLQADWQGGWEQWLKGLQNPAAYPDLRLNAQLQSNSFRLEMPAAATPATAKGAAKPEPTRIAIQQLQASVQGNLHTATLGLEGDVTANGTRTTLNTALQARQVGQQARGNPAWQIDLRRLQAAATLPKESAPWRLEVAEGLQVTARPGDTLQVQATAGTARLTPPAHIAPAEQALTLAWEPLSFSRTAQGTMRLQSKGRVAGIHPAWVDALSPPGQAPLRNAGLFTNLVLAGQWDIDMADSLNIQAVLQRESGDLWLGEPASQTPDAVQAVGNTRTEAIAAGIETLRLSLQSRSNRVEAVLDWKTRRAGTIDARVQTQLVQTAQGWSLPPTAALAGQVKAAFPDLGVWGSFAPPGWRINGSLNADVALGGTVQQPRLQGQIAGDGLNVRSVLDGVDLHNGSLRANLQGNRLTIAELRFEGGTNSNAYVAGMSGNRTPAPMARGQMVARGFIDWSRTLSASGSAADSGIDMNVQAQLQQMQVLARNDRQISLSGDLSAGLQNGRLRLRGDLLVDRASITLPESSAPTLGDDVVVIRASDPPQDEAEPTPRLQTAQPMDMEIRLNLGRDFALQGYGITTRLEGDLTVRSQRSGNDPIAIVGEIRTDEGRYRAWGQALNVETGVVLFNGPYNNPSLNMLAVRPNIDVRAGVRVTGTALAPRVQLYSEPELPDAEKLSWVVLGRATMAGGGEGTSMQQAALGLLAGSVANSLASGLGFDEVGLSTEGVSLGKRLSDKLYVTYATGMSGAAGTLYIFYDISRRLTARGQTGEQSALDLIYTITYD